MSTTLSPAGRQAAHAQGIWHRDIKPENILLDKEGKVKIAAFGIARIGGDPQLDFTLTRTGSALGGVSYMAPEQHEKPHEVDHRADIYSLGVVIYEMLTCELPLGRFPSPSQRAAVDSRIDEIVLKTLEKERDMRQQSASEVKTDVHRVIAGGNVQQALEAGPQAKRGLGRLAFRIFLSGILFPCDLWIISPEAGFILSALMMLLPLVLGCFSLRETLGKVAFICSLLILLIYAAFLVMMCAEQAAGPVAIELGEVRGVGIARVKLNGSDLGITWRPSFRVALEKAAKAGTNTLEFTAINSWCNRVMADDKLSENKRVTQTNIRVQKQGRFKWKPELSGLIGPVRISRRRIGLVDREFLPSFQPVGRLNARNRSPDCVTKWRNQFADAIFPTRCT